MDGNAGSILGGQQHAINRTTGYIGSSTLTLGQKDSGTHFSGGDDVSAALLDDGIENIAHRVDITLLPPRLKVWARRLTTVPAGSHQGVKREYLIGNEGAANPHDNVIAIFTQWLDEKDRPLPEGLGLMEGKDFGLVGRLAQVNASGELDAASTGWAQERNTTIVDLEKAPRRLNGTRVVEFPIAPGEHMQLIRLKADNTSNQYFHVQVFGRAYSKDPCPHCEYDGSGRNPGMLAQRPNHFTPFYVPRFDEAATLEAQRTRNEASPNNVDPVEPIYQWLQRPDYQFSLIDLTVQAINVQQTVAGQAQVRNLLTTLPASVSLPDELVTILYRLFLPATNALETIEGPREYVLALGAEEIIISASANRPPGVFDNIDQFGKLKAEDFLSIRLYLNGDSENILWEYAFGPGKLGVVSSANPESRAQNSFTVCEDGNASLCADPDDTENRIVAYVNEAFPPDATIVWKVEAFSGNTRGDDLPATVDGTNVAAARPYAYGGIKESKVGADELGIGTAVGGNGKSGGFQDAWTSTSEGHNLLAKDARFISFKVDMTGGGDSLRNATHSPELYREGMIGSNPACVGGQFSQCVSGTNRTDVWRHNPYLKYRITASVGDKQYEGTVKMDEIDVLRQEYVNHKRSIRSVNATHAGAIQVPLRSQFVLLDSLIGSPGDWVDLTAPTLEDNYLYHYVIEDGMIGLAIQALGVLNTSGLNVKGTNVTNGEFAENDISFPAGTQIKVNSGYRNPERQERVGKATCSKHMLGRAVDIGPSKYSQYTFRHDPPGVGGDKSKTARIWYVIWKAMLAHAPDRAQMMQLEWQPNDAMLRVNKLFGSWQGSGGTLANPIPPADMLFDIDEDEDRVPDSYMFARHLHVQIGVEGGCP